MPVKNDTRHFGDVVMGWSGDREAHVPAAQEPGRSFSLGGTQGPDHIGLSKPEQGVWLVFCVQWAAIGAVWAEEHLTFF